MALFIAFSLFLIALLIQAYYCICRLVYINRMKVSAVSGEQAREFPVSVVICAHDEEENLKRLLPSIFRQNHKKMEVVVVDDRSNDNTYDYLLQQKSIHDNLKIVNVEKTPAHVNGKKYGLTLGIKAAKYEHILLTDADCEPLSDDWVSLMAQAYDENTQIVLGYSPYLKAKGLLNNFIRFETLCTGIQYLSAAQKGRPYMGVGRNLSYRKSFFVDRKGFNKYLKVIGGDDDLFVNEHSDKYNTKIVIGEKANVASMPKQTWSSYLSQKIRHLSVGKFYKKKDKLHLGTVALSQILFWVLLIVLSLFRFELYYLLGGYIIKLALLTILFYRAGKRLGDKINLWLMPLFDFLWFVYYLIIGARALFTRKVKWT